MPVKIWRKGQAGAPSAVNEEVTTLTPEEVKNLRQSFSAVEKSTGKSRKKGYGLHRPKR